MLSPEKNKIIIKYLVFIWASYLFWSLLLEFFSQVYFLNLATLSINASILLLVFLFTPACLAIPRVQLLFTKHRTIGFFTSLLGLIGYFSPIPLVKAFLLALGFGGLFTFLVAEWKNKSSPSSFYVSSIIGGIILLLLARFSWISRNVLWYSSVSILVGLLITLVLGYFVHVSSQVKKEQNVNPQSAHNESDGNTGFKAIISLAIALFISHWLFTGYGIIPRWVSLSPNTGLLLILALLLGVWINSNVDIETVFVFVALLFGGVLLSYGSSWIGFLGGVFIGLTLPWLWKIAIQYFEYHSYSKTIPLSILIYLLFSLGSVFTVVYDYVPMGWVFREREEALLLLAILLIIVPFATKKPVPSIKLKKPVDLSEFLVLVFLALLLTPIAFGFREALFQSSYSPQTQDIVAMTFNIQQGFDTEGNINLDRVASIIMETRANIIGLQETDTMRISTGNRDVVEYLASKLGMNSYYGPETRDSTFGNALLTAYPILTADTILLPSKGEIAVLIHAVLLVKNEKVHVFVAHFGETEEDRMQQAEETARLIKEVQGPLILLGDFNSTPDSQQVHVIVSAGVNETYSVTHQGFHEPTVVDGNKTIDMIFTRGFTITQVFVWSKDSGSDHLPVYAILVLE